MAELVARALDAGALGLSTGLEYVPGWFADRAELAAVAGPVGARGALVASHVRSEDADAIEAAVGELLQQCEDAGAAAHLSHAKVVHAREPVAAERVLAMLDDARSRGIRATADVYPYVASYTGLSILFPDWALPPHDYAEVVADRRAELAAHLRRRVESRNGPAATLFGSGPYAARTLEQVAMERGVPFEDVLIELGASGASAAYFVMAEPVMERFLRDEHVMVASDGSPTMLHPRGHGTFARVLERYVRERGMLSLEAAVHKMTGLPAATVGLADRGVLRTGAIADLVVFDLGRVHDRATFTAPFERAAGFEQVLVGGVPVIADGVPTGARPGRALRRGR
ncbi:MAG: amidohydrolase family protein [Planctomycetes bacterium]|nr:amidohydrolase family protein [Planctomycetota bacterium]